MRRIFVALLLVIFSQSILAYNSHGLGHMFYYIGINSGASVATFQGNDNYSDTEELPPPSPPPPYMASHNNEASARGYNGGLFFGYNFYTHDHVVLGLELSGNLYTNRGYYTIHYYNPNNGSSSAFEFSFDIDFSVHLNLRPQYTINENNLIYLLIGLGYADINVRAANQIATNVGSFPNPVDSRESSWGLTFGGGLQHRISSRLSAFAAYEYTRYRNITLKEVFQDSVEGGQELQGAFRERNADVDTNVFKLGFIFTF